jgi:hypothetical protein
VPTNNFSALLDELHAADTARQRAPLRKAQGADWIAEWTRGRHEREAVAARSSRSVFGSLERLTRQADGMLKAMPAPQPSPRESLARAYGHFTKLVAEGRLSAVDACRAEARFHHLAEALR